MAEGRLDKEHFIRHSLGALLWVVLGWGLLRARRWAWYVVVYISGTLGLLGAGLIVFCFLLPGQARDAFIEGAERTLRVGKQGPPLFLLSVAVLAGIVLSLLRKEARDAFFLRPRE